MPETKLDPALIEWVVQEVIRRLRASGAAAAREDEKAEDELRLDEPLVALATLDGRLKGVQRVLVARRAVITPAAKDELKDRGIELVRDR